MGRDTPSCATHLVRDANSRFLSEGRGTCRSRHGSSTLQQTTNLRPGHRRQTAASLLRVHVHYGCLFLDDLVLCAQQMIARVSVILFHSHTALRKMHVAHLGTRVCV